MSRVLLIAPDHLGVSWAAEAELLGGVLPTVPLVGPVDHARLTRATSGQRFSILHVAAHADASGVMLSDGLLSRDELVQIARHVRADLVFLNACGAAALGQFLVCRGVPAVVTYTVDVLDRNALRTASFYYEDLVEHNHDYKLAFDKVNPCDGSLAWFAGAGYVERAVEPVIASLTLLQGDVRLLRRTLLAVGVVLVLAILLAVGLLWAVLLPGVWAQNGTVPPSPLDTPTEIEATAPPTLLPTPLPTRRKNHHDDDATPTATLMPTSTTTPTATLTAPSSPTKVSTPTPWPTVVLPTLTPDWPATLTALPPC